MSAIDLHTHTSISDGTDTPQQLIDKAVAANIDILSITDHNTVGAYDILLSTGYLEHYRGRFVNGVELGVCFRSLSLEILAYGFDLPSMQQYIAINYSEEKTQQIERDLFMKCKTKLLDMGFILNPDLEYTPPFCAEALQIELWRYPQNIERFPAALVDYPGLLYRYFNDPSSEFYVFDCYSPDCGEVIDAIHETGGRAFLAHPCVYLVDDPAGLAEKVAKSTRLDGVEVFYPLHTPDQIQKLLGVVDGYGLLVSGGSDYHGLNKPDIQLVIGRGELQVPEKYIRRWLPD